MKLYELDIPATSEEKEEGEKDFTRIVPFASGAEPFRGEYYQQFS